jgi:hypothetical protein
MRYMRNRRTGRSDIYSDERYSLTDLVNFARFVMTLFSLRNRPVTAGIVVIPDPLADGALIGAATVREGSPAMATSSDCQTHSHRCSTGTGPDHFGDLRS